MGKVTAVESGGILQVTINRPERRNAIDFDVMNELSQILAGALHNERILALTIIGSGTKAFCSGGDLSVFHALESEEEAFEMLSRMGDILYRIAAFPLPVFALINGTAVGGGMEIAAAADFRLVSESAELGFIQGRQAITTGWGGGALLFEKMQHDAAMTMLMSGRKIGAVKAKELGFASEVLEASDFESKALHYVKESLVSFPPVLKAYKQMQVEKWMATGLRDRMNKEIRQCAKLWTGEEHMRLVQNFLAKNETAKKSL